MYLKSDWIPAGEAARMLGYKHTVSLTRRIEKGVLRGRMEGGRWWVLLKEVEQLQRLRNPCPCPSCGGLIRYQEKMDGRWRCRDCKWQETNRGHEIKMKLRHLLRLSDQELRAGVQAFVHEMISPAGDD